MDNLIRFSLVLTAMVAVAITAASGEEVNVSCLVGGNVDGCQIVGGPNITAADTLTIANVDQFKDVTELGVNDVVWEVIPSGIFIALPHLHRIEVSASVARLTRDSFVNASNLKTIQLSGNHIDRIPQDVFLATPNVRLIDLTANQIHHIEDGAFTGLTHLIQFSLTRNALRIIRNGTFAGAVSLRRIELDRNEIDHIEANAFALPSLEYIDLGHNRLKTFAANAFSNAPLLQTLILNDNELWQINDALAEWTPKKLNVLVLANNPVESIDLALIGQWPELENFNARNTTSDVFVRATPTNASTATSINGTRLEAIDLSGNNLTRADILFVLAIFPHLNEVNLESNAFTKIDRLGHAEDLFKNVRWLYIGCNRFECPWLANELQTLNAILDVLSCPDPTVIGAKNVRNVNCV